MQSIQNIEQELQAVAPVGTEAKTSVYLDGWTYAPRGWELREFRLTLAVTPLDDGMSCRLYDNGTNGNAEAAASQRWFAEHAQSSNFEDFGRLEMGGVVGGCEYAPPITLLHIVSDAIEDPSTVWTVATQMVSC